MCTSMRALVLGVLVVVLAAAMPVRAANASRPFDYVVGKGTNAAGETFTFVAHTTPNGAAGHARIIFPPSANYPQGFTVRGRVTCVQVHSANSATLGFVIQHAVGSVPENSVGFEIFVIDGELDIMGTGFTQAAPDCVGQGGATPVSQGDIVVYQAR